MAIGPDGSLYLAENLYIRRIGPDGIITSIASDIVQGLPVKDMAISPDGAVYFVDTASQIRRVETDGVARPVPGYPSAWAIAFHPKTGDLYFRLGGAVQALDAQGVVRPVAGCPVGGSCYWSGDATYHGQALNPLSLALSGSSPGDLAFTPDGRLAIADQNWTRLWEIGSDGLIRGSFGSAPNVRAFREGIEASFDIGVPPVAISYGPGGLFLSGGTGGNGDTAVWAVREQLPGLGQGDIAVPAASGEEIYIFDPTGRHTQTRNALTQAVIRTFQYDPMGYLASMQDAFGQETTIERDGAGSPTAVIAPGGQRTELTVGADGYLESASLPGGRLYSMAYNGGGLMTEFGTPLGVGWMTYDSNGRISTDEDPEGAIQSLARTEYGDGSWSVERTTELGQVTSYRIERNNDGTERRVNVLPDGTSSVWERDVMGGGQTIMPDGTIVGSVMTADPRFSVTSPIASSTTTTLPGGLTQTRTASRSVTLSNPDDPTTLVTQTDTASVAGRTSQSVYTASVRRYDHRTPLNRLSQEFLDQFGRTIEMRAGGSPNVRTVYTADKVTAIVIDPDTTPGNGNERTTLMAYDAAGRLISVTDPMTKTTAFTDFNAADRPDTVVLPGASELQMTYDVMGNVTSVTPPGQAPHDMTYGLHGRIESYTPPVGNTVSYQYDLDRHVDLIDFGLDGLGQPAQVDFEWDNPAGHLLSISSPTGTIDVGYTLGRMTSLVAPSQAGPITTNLAYDGPLPTSLGWSGPVSGQVNWTYNDRFLIQTETIGALASTAVTYSYDNDGLVMQAGAMTITRDAASGRVLTKTVGNIRETYTYSTFGELARQTVHRMNGATVVETLYDAIYAGTAAQGQRDALGRITRRTESIVAADTPLSGARPLTTRVYDYGYNADGRPWLESVAVNGNVVSAYGYDDNGNRTSANLNWSQLGYSASLDGALDETDTEYNDADQLLTYGLREYTWNPFGQLESMLDTATQQETAYEYDLFGNLLTVALPDGRTVEYDVDGAGRRVGRRVLDAQGVELEYRGWLYRDLLRPIAEVDAAGKLVARYVYPQSAGAKQNGPTQLAGRLGAGPTSYADERQNVPALIELLDTNGAMIRRLRLITDRLGSVVAVADVTSGEIVQRLEYDDHGRVLVNTAPGLHPFGFHGGLADQDTELVRFGARDYSPSVGRWTARDPLAMRGGPNAFLYSRNSPTVWKDGTGYKPWKGPGWFDVVDWIFDINPIPDATDVFDWASPDLDEMQDINEEWGNCQAIRARGLECCYAGNGVAYACGDRGDCDPNYESCDPSPISCDPDDWVSTDEEGSF